MLDWPVVELIEAATRAGDLDTAHAAYERLSNKASVTGTHWALGLEARSHALLIEGEEAESHCRESIDHLGRTLQRTDLARAHLVYGEWLRRARRRVDSREQLSLAQRMFEKMRMQAFADRAARELRATGQAARKRTPIAEASELTPQEAQVARLARDGLTNPEIGTRLFISSHTVQYHLRKVFAKLGISSRAQLDRALRALVGCVVLLANRRCAARGRDSLSLPHGYYERVPYLVVSRKQSRGRVMGTDVLAVSGQRAAAPDAANPLFGYPAHDSVS